MNKISTIILTCLFSINLLSQNKLTIEIKGLHNNKGLVLFELYNANHQVLKQERIQIKNQVCTLQISDLKPGKYAVRYFQDENLNSKIDKNFLGIPTEGYGFSNNVLAPFGPPDFNEWLFDLKSDMKLMLKIKYH